MKTLPKKLDWMKREDIRPYVFVRQANRIVQPGRLHAVDYFQKAPIYKDPLRVEEVGFANSILDLEGKAFGAAGLAMERWVFYDCAIMPGFVAGYAIRRESLPASFKAVLNYSDSMEWVPLSLFIIIPTMAPREWVAHNLCSINSLVPREDRLWGLGFISKAFGLWYANVETCIGMTQWKSPALKLHSHYGNFKIVTAYTPVHTYAKTLTYRLDVDPGLWPGFWGESVSHTFRQNYASAGFNVNPDSEESLRDFQAKIEAGGEFFLDAEEILSKAVEAPLEVYLPK